MNLPDLSGAERIVVVTGAGISAPSGMLTFRGPGGFWENDELMRASHKATYAQHLDLLWEFWGARRGDALSVEPNAAHIALADRERSGSEVTVVTQNVDGLHQRAGNATVMELHGSLFRNRCVANRCRQPIWDDLVVRTTPPPCPTCGRDARPDIVLFGENLSKSMVIDAEHKLRAADVCLVVGTSGVVWPASELVSVAKHNGALCVLVNAEEWDHPHPAFDLTLIGACEEILPEMLDR